MNKRGIALILTFMVIVVLTILGSATISRSVSERFITQRYAESTKAFWLAEAGINRAIAELSKDHNWNGTTEPIPLGNGEYNVVVELDPQYTTRRKITSTGSVGNIHRIINVIVELPSASVTVAIETTGGLNITGSASIDSYETDSTATFESIFGITKDAVKSMANHLYTNPPLNQQPIDGITWIDLTGDTPQTATEYKITSDWSGSGLLIIDGHRNDSTEDITALEISGNWNFDGIIWVMGKIKITGTPIIQGGVFAETTVEVDSTLGGNATLSWNSGAVAETFSLLGPASMPDILSWREI